MSSTTGTPPRTQPPAGPGGPPRARRVPQRTVPAHIILDDRLDDRLDVRDAPPSQRDSDRHRPGSGGPNGPGGPNRPGGPNEPPWLTALRRFVRRHGWRAYALPVLVVVTIAGLASLGSGHGRSSDSANPPAPAVTRPAVSPTSGPAGSTGSSAPSGRTTTPTGSASSSVKVDPTNTAAEELASDQLPPGKPYTVQGQGTFAVIAGTSPVVGSGPVRRYVIEAERGITGVDLKQFAATVVATLDDPRSWTGGPKNVSLQRVATEAQADFRVALTSSMTVRPVCGYDLKVETSCWDDQNGPSRVYLNVARWVRGDASFGQDLTTYHLYMVNHEVGHALGHVHTFVCLPNGSAPVMMQQTLTLKENEGAGPKTCTPNAWPFPVGVDPAVAVPT